MDVNRRFFEGLMRDKKLSLRGLAARMNLSHSQLSLAFSGDRKLQLEEAVQLSSILGQPLTKIIEAVGVSVRMTPDLRVPVIGAVQGDGTVKMTPEDVAERTIAPDMIPPDSVAVQFRTAGTVLEWCDGAVCFCERPGPMNGSIVGRFSLLKITDGDFVVGTPRRGYRDNSYNIRGPFEADSVKLELGAPILLTRN